MIAAAKQGWDLGVPLFFGVMFGVWIVYRYILLELRRWDDRHLRMSKQWQQANRRHPSGRGI